MLHRVVLLRKRTFLTSAFILIATTLFLRWRATSGYLPWVLLGAGLFPLVFMIVYWIRGRMNPYLILEGTRAEVDRLFSIGAGNKSKLRALRLHLAAYELSERKTGSVKLSLYPYQRHLQACIKDCRRPELPLRRQIELAVPVTSPTGVVDGFYDDKDQFVH